MKKITLGFFLALLAAFLALPAAAQQTGAHNITVTETAATITTDSTCSQIQCLSVVIKENSASPTAVFTITPTGATNSVTLAAGSSFEFDASPQRPYQSGAKLGTIVSSTSGPFTFTIIESAARTSGANAAPPPSGGGGSTPTLNQVLNPTADSTFALGGYNLIFDDDAGTSEVDIAAGAGLVLFTTSGELGLIDAGGDGAMSIEQQGAALMNISTASNDLDVTAGGSGNLNLSAGGDIAIWTNTSGVSIESGGNGNDVFISGFGAGVSIGDFLQVDEIITNSSTPVDSAGYLTASAGTASYSFTGTYVLPPVCQVQDTTLISSLLTVTVTNTSLTATTTGATDLVSYICVGLN